MLSAASSLFLSSPGFLYGNSTRKIFTVGFFFSIIFD